MSTTSHAATENRMRLHIRFDPPAECVTREWSLLVLCLPEYSIQPYFKEFRKFSGLWYPCWEGRNDPPLPSCTGPSYTDRTIHQALNGSNRLKLIISGHPWTMVTHELNLIPVRDWFLPGAGLSLQFMSPFGVMRRLVPTKHGNWRLHTMLEGSQGQQCTAHIGPTLTAEEVRQLARRHGWLTLIPGYRAPAKGSRPGPLQTPEQTDQCWKKKVNR